MPQIEVFPDSDALANHAATVFQDLANAALTTSNRFTVALSGGSTPKKLYENLINANLDWSRIHFFWVDERYVPPDHSENNYRMAADALLDHIDIPFSNIHRIKGEMSLNDAARDYENELRSFFLNRLPVFDLILLGLGTDGHTASLFPGSPVLKEKERWAIEVKHDIPPPPLVDRVTLTFPVIKAAKRIIFLVTGIEKAGILARIFKTPSIPDSLPVEVIIKNHPNTRWFIDWDSAGGWYE
jgi:6-phosphogluconolactonase